MSGMVAFAAENLSGHTGKHLIAKIAKRAAKDAKIGRLRLQFVDAFFHG